MSRDDYMSTGPVSSRPGQMWPHAQKNPCQGHEFDSLAGTCPEGTKADWTIQGETDSFGCEYFYLCNCCMEKWKAEQNAPRDGYCTFHEGSGKDIRPARDILGEGNSGPVYDMCADCRRKLQEDAELEAEYWERKNFHDD